MKMTINIDLFDEKIDLSGKYLLTGFHGIGAVGYITTKYLVEKTDVQRIGIITSPLTPPLVSLDEEGHVQLPFEIFAGGDHPFVYLVVRFTPHPSELRDFTRELVTFTRKRGMAGMVLIGGLDRSFRPDDDEHGFKCVVSNGFPTGRLCEGDPPLLDAGLFISGGVAMILMELEMQQVPCLTLFPYADRNRPDMEAASRAIGLLNRLFDLDVQTEDLLKEARDFEAEIESIMQQEEKQQRYDSNDMYT